MSTPTLRGLALRTLLPAFPGDHPPLTIPARSWNPWPRARRAGRWSSSAGTPTATGGARALVETLSRRHPAVILVEMGWPPAWRPAGALAYVATYGAARAVSEILRSA